MPIALSLCVCFAASVSHGLDLVQVLVNVSASDGSVSAWTTGCEIGQGLFVKVAGTISQALGVDINKVSVMEVNTQVSVTALSSCMSRCTLSVAFTLLTCCGSPDDSCLSVRSHRTQRSPAARPLQSVAALQLVMHVIF